MQVEFLVAMEEEDIVPWEIIGHCEMTTLTALDSGPEGNKIYFF
jgi:hypothetical protein